MALSGTATRESTTTPSSPTPTVFEQQREELVRDIAVGMEQVLQNINRLNRNLESIVSVGKEFSSVEALWSQFENFMGRSEDGDEEGHPGSNVNSNANSNANSNSRQQQQHQHQRQQQQRQQQQEGHNDYIENSVGRKNDEKDHIHGDEGGEEGDLNTSVLSDR